MRYPALISSIAVALAALLASPGGAAAQGLTVLVNGEPITPSEIATETRWQNLRYNFSKRMKAVLTGDAVKRKFRRRLSAANPRSVAEAQEAAGRIKQELLEEARMQVLSEGGGKAVTEALIERKLKLQAAKKLGIEIDDREVEQDMARRMAARGGAGGARLDVNAYYSQLEALGIGPEAIQEAVRAELAWRAVVCRTYGKGPGWEVYGAHGAFSQFYLRRLRKTAVIEYRG
jgi:peptidyl-prolyl cis-trans isomerase SurA